MKDNCRHKGNGSKMKTRFHQKLDREEKENERAIDPILEELKLR